MFLDASAFVAILTDEEDAEELTNRLDQAEEIFTSPVALFETAAALMRIKGETAEGAHETLRAVVELAGVRVVAITEGIGYLALEAYGAYGKGQGHPAQLNMGDCFAYACARAHRLPLIYKGNDFAQTDLAYRPGMNID